MKKVRRLTVDAIAYGGEAVGRLDTGEVCFFRGALPGEEVEIEITEEKKRFARGKVISRFSNNPERITPACPYAQECPGCSFQHCSYELELEWKQKQFERFLKGFPGERLPIFPSPQRFNWRNRLKVACEKGVAGYRGFDNTTLVSIERCLLCSSKINEAFSNSVIPDAGTLFFRSTPEFCGNVEDHREKYLTETLPGAGTFHVPPRGFFQTNIPVAAELCARVTAAIAETGAQKMVELYCGVGVFSIAAALKNPLLQCSGTELAPDSIEAAHLNAAVNGVQNRCRFQSGDAADVNLQKRYDLLLLDPPRSGVEKKLLHKILKSGIPHLLYVSCGPDTLRRDLELLSEKYSVVTSGALDMFPCTAHFETFTILTLSK